MGIRQTSALTFFVALGLIALAPSSGCSSKSNGSAAESGDGGGQGGSSSSGGMMGFGNPVGDAAPVQTCTAGTNFKCQQVSCGAGKTTSLTGTVYDPAGKIPLYNVSVYVPNTIPQALPQGVDCGSCSTWYTSPVVSAVTDPGGNFTITNMPVGANIPLIVQVGKWRMQYTLSNVVQCVENQAETLTGKKLQMPHNHMVGDIPNIAVSTGSADSLECLLLRMGLDSNEYTGDPMGAGRIKIFTGGDSAAGLGGAITNAPQSKQSYQYLWNTDAAMEAFDLVLLSCEGSETSFLSDAGRTVLSDYTNDGGRVFASHYHYSWFTPTGPFSMVSPPWRRGRRTPTDSLGPTRRCPTTATS